MATIRWLAGLGAVLLVTGVVLYYRSGSGDLGGPGPETAKVTASAGPARPLTPAPPPPPPATPPTPQSPSLPAGERSGGAEPLDEARIREALERMDGQALRKVPPTLFLAEYEPTAEEGAGNPREGTIVMNGRFMGRAATVRDLLAMAYGVNRTRLRMAEGVSLPAGRFDYLVSLASGQKEALQKLLRERFGLVARTMTREEPVYVMTARPGDFDQRRPSEDESGPTRSRHEGGAVRLENATLGLIVGNLETLLELPVVDESGLRGRFDVSLTLERPRGEDPARRRPAPDQIRQAVAEQLGLELTREQRELEVMLVERAG